MVRHAIRLAAGLILAASSLPGQDASSRESPGTWGPASGYTTLMHHRFQGANPEFYYLQNGASQGSWCEGQPTGECLGYAQLEAPDGAALDRLEIWGHDSSADSDMHYTFIESCDGESGQTETILDQGDLLGSSGDYQYGKALSDVTVNNSECGYTVRFKFTDPGDPPQGNLIRLRKVRVTWRRQVSPAPATATFGDVPTDHLFYQFIEALAKSGITGGCGGGNYCPDLPLTRGQMAVFLAKALGLQWALPPQPE